METLLAGFYCILFCHVVLTRLNFEKGKAHRYQLDMKLRCLLVSNDHCMEHACFRFISNYMCPFVRDVSMCILETGGLSCIGAVSDLKNSCSSGCGYRF